MYRIGVDIGGMSIKSGIVDEKGNIYDSTRVKTCGSPLNMIGTFCNSIMELLNKNKISLSEVKGIGVGCPGAVSSKTGMVEFLPNLGWIKVPLREEMQKFFGTKMPIEISNDANVAVLGEAKYGVAKGAENAVMFTIGTGVGGGMIVDGKLCEGGYSRGAELGHISLFADGLPCTCGRKGCIEVYISATALIRQTKEQMLLDKKSKMWDFVGGDIENVDGRTAFECEKMGDESAKKVIDKYIYYFGESILDMLNIFRPEIFIIGGGVSAQGENLTSRLTEYCEKFDYGYKDAPKTKIVTAKLGNGAGIIGAAALIEL